MEKLLCEIATFDVKGHMNLTFIDTYPVENFHQVGELRYIISSEWQPGRAIILLPKRVKFEMCKSKLHWR